MVAIADVLAKVALEASKEPEPGYTSGDFTTMVGTAARTLHHGLQDRDVHSVRLSALGALAAYLVELRGARQHQHNEDTVGAWLACVDGETARNAIAATGISLRAGVLR